MSEFTVISRPDDGYGASMAATGSRVAEKIQNLPYAIEVITMEFIEDLGFTDLDDSFAYASSFGGFDSGSGNINMRGTGVGKQLRNGFLRIGVVNRANVERIEIIKGPSAAVYGECLPAGLVNIVTRKPKLKKTAKLSTRAGSNNLFGFDAEVTGPLTMHPSRKTSFIIDASYFRTDYDQPYADLRTRLLSGAVQHKFSQNTSLLIEAEFTDRLAHLSAPVPAVRHGGRTGTGAATYPRLATEVAGFNWYGPNELSWRSLVTYDATFEHRFNRVLSLRVAGNWFKRNVNSQSNNVSGGVNPFYDESFLNGSGVETTPNPGRITNRLPGIGSGDESGYGAQADLLAHYWLARGALENRTLLTVDYSNYNRTNPQWRMAAADANSSGFGRVLDPENPNYFWPSPDEWLYSLYRWDDCTTEVYGVFLRHQTAAWGGRFILAGGLRYDYMRQDLRREKEVRDEDPSNDFYGVRSWDLHTDNFTPNIGINFDVVEGVRGYANYARSFFVNSQTNSYVPDRDITSIENETGFGLDYGVKVDVFDHRLRFTFGGFYIVRRGVQATDDNGDTRRIGEIFSRGLEFDATYRLDNPRFTTNLRFGYGYTNAKYTDKGNDYDALQRPMAGIPQHNAYFAWTQVWKRGLLRGIRTTLGVTYTGESHPWSDRGGISTTLPNGKTYILSHSGFRDIKIGDYFSTRASIAYKWRVGKWQHEVSATAANLLNQDVIQRNRQVMPEFNLSLAYTIKL
ncbi:MAG: TonB-dependent receptor [Opitutaceae bacterium]|jgi:outer membrane receptor protein involved in Fe transport|nr:TonB-dependent receptor [Opitutaceae bacterium]